MLSSGINGATDCDLKTSQLDFCKKKNPYVRTSKADPPPQHTWQPVEGTPPTVFPTLPFFLLFSTLGIILLFCVLASFPPLLYPALNSQMPTLQCTFLLLHDLKPVTTTIATVIMMILFRGHFLCRVKHGVKCLMSTISVNFGAALGA